MVLLDPELGVQFLSTNLTLQEHCYLLKEYELRVAGFFTPCTHPPEPGAG